MTQVSVLAASSKLLGEGLEDKCGHAWPGAHSFHNSTIPSGLPFTFSQAHLETNTMGEVHMLGYRTE